MRSIAFFIFFVLMLQIGFSQSSNFIFKQINRASGLPVDEVTCLAQDSTGFIWIGSKEGLFRFDGFSYKRFYHTPGNLQTIPNNFISKLYVDKEGILWIGTNWGIALMKSNGQLLNVFNSATESSFVKESDGVFDIQEDKNIVWISTADGLFSVNKKGTQITGIQKHDLKKYFNYSTNQFGEFVIDSKGKLWLCTLHGLVIYDPIKKELLHAGNNPSALNILQEKNAFHSLSIDENKRTIRYTTWEPAERIYSMDENKITTIYSGKDSANPNFGNLISQFLKDNQRTTWMASGNGIKIVKNDDNREQSILHKADNQYSIQSNYVTSLLQDKEGSIWVGTNAGISITQPYKQSLVNLSSNSIEEHSFANSSVNTIIPVDANTFLIGGLGVYRTDAEFKVKEHYTFGSSTYDWIWTYYKQGDSIFISTQKGNLIYHIKTKKLKKLTQPPFDKFYPVFSFVPGNDSTIWMSRYNNDFLHYDPKTKTYKKFNLAQLGEEPAVLQMSRDNDNNLWLVSSAAGLLKFDETKEKITERLEVNKKNGLQETHILFLKDIGEELLIGYVSKGISLYHKKNKTFRHLSRSDGLTSNSVIDALQTDKNTVWIATRNGISQFNIKTNNFINYGYDNGILQNDFECIAQLPDGRIAAGSKGLIHFYPQKINAQQILSAPIITNINLYGKDLPVDSFSVNNPLEIPYNNNYFSFDYITLQFQNNQQIEYAYMLEGFDRDWVHAGSRRFASYSNVTGGSYKLRIRARLSGEQWVENKISLPIIVHTAFYKKAWFYILCTILLATVLYIIFRFQLTQTLRLERTRASISSDLHDEVGATLSSISIFSEMAKQSLHSASKAEPFLQRIGDRSRDSIQKMSDIIWSINPDNDSLQQIIIRMKTFVNETAEGKDITVHWEENEMLSKLKLGMAQRKNFYLLFKEAVINALKYANAKNIYVQLSAHKKMVTLIVRDDGKGFSFETIKLGNGISNIKQRALLLNGIANIESVPGKGTTVYVQFQY